MARREGLFDWLAAFAARRANGSASRLFLIIHVFGTVMTAFLSSDAAAVVLTPAMFAATRAAGVDTPLACLFICAFIANAAGFVLPNSNPANLVLHASRTQPLLDWLAHFTLLSIIATDIEQPLPPRGGGIAAAGIGLAAVVLLVSHCLDLQLGLSTAIAGLPTVLALPGFKREAPWDVLRGISWAVFPSVVRLLVLVQGLSHTGR